MDNKEAINWLTRIRDRLMPTSSKQYEAMTIAIAALGQQERETQEKPFPFVVGQPAEMFFDGKWEKGKIVAGYRFGDGVVTIETEDGRKLWCGQDRTDIYRPYQEDQA
jgi:hypothetical protein